MGNSGLTQKRMGDGRFRRAERAIFIAYYKLRDCPSAKILARRAGISRSTLYRHHKKVQSILADYEDYLFHNYKKSLRPLIKKKAPLKTLALRSLVFIYSNRRVIQILFQNRYNQIVGRIVDYLKPIIIESWCSPDNTDKMFWVYKEGVLGVIEEWCERGFESSELDRVLDNILYLTRTAYRNLLPLK